MTVDEKYLTDWSGLRRGSPRIIEKPQSTAEISTILKKCYQLKQAVTIQGGLTGLAGGGVPATGDVVINLERMNQIESLDELEGIMVVQAGATLEQVQQAADSAGWFFPVDLGARGSCQVGGNASTNAGGERVLRYGTMRDSILGLEVALPNGTILNSMTQLVKNSTGIDLKHMFIGSEGTLGVITRLVLKLQPRPGKATAALLDIQSIEQVPVILRDLKMNLGPLLTAYEFMSKEFFDFALINSHRKLPIDLQCPWRVLVEVTDVAGIDASDLLQNRLMGLIEQELVADVLMSQSEKDRLDFWSIRQAIPEILTKLRPSVNFDIGLPWKHIPGYIEKIQNNLNVMAPQAQHLFFGHLGDNNIHLITGPHPLDQHEQIEADVYEELGKLEGTISAEHGIGFIKKPFLHITRDQSQLELVKQIKTCIDPLNLLNPGRII